MPTNKLITFGIIVAIIVVFITGCNGQASIVNQPGPYDQIAQCLTEKGATLYQTSWCPHCKNQKEVFGTSLQYINLVDCDEERAVCQKADIEGYPAWIINDEQYLGGRSPEALAEIAGCDF